MMKSITRRAAVALTGFAALAMLTSGAGLVTAQAADEKKLHVSNAWARPSIGKTGRSAAYFQIANHGTGSDRLLAVKGDVSEKIEIHTVIKEGDVMRMRAVEGGVDIPVGETIAFEPGGLHVMLIGLKQPLELGNSFPLTLVFEKAGEIDIDFAVRKTAARDSHSHHKH